jgi:hypothetical protein
MSATHDETNRKLGLTLQIKLLERSLDENQKSWEFCKLPSGANTVAESIRRDIAEKRSQLATE